MRVVAIAGTHHWCVLAQWHGLERSVFGPATIWECIRFTIDSA